MIVKYTNKDHSKGPQKYTQIGILGMKTFYLATLSRVPKLVCLDGRGSIKLTNRSFGSYNPFLCSK
jgi:hypothetical protein